MIEGFRRLGGWQERPFLWCLHAVSSARDTNPFVLFGRDTRGLDADGDRTQVTEECDKAVDRGLVPALPPKEGGRTGHPRWEAGWFPPCRQKTAVERCTHDGGSHPVAKRRRQGWGTLTPNSRQSTAAKGGHPSSCQWSVVSCQKRAAMRGIILATYATSRRHSAGFIRDRRTTRRRRDGWGGSGPRGFHEE